METSNIKIITNLKKKVQTFTMMITYKDKKSDKNNGKKGKEL